MTTYEELELAIRARVPLLALVTHEEARAEERLLLPLAREWRQGRLFLWTATDGLQAAPPPSRGEAGAPAPPPLPSPDPMAALEAVAAYDDPAIFVFKDFHHYLESPPLLRKLRDLARRLVPTGKHIVFLGPRFRTPEDLEKEIQIVDYPPPGADELEALLDELAESFRAQGEEVVRLTPEGRERLLQAALGLTRTEAEVVLAKALVRDGALTDAAAELVLAEKQQIVRRSGILEFYEVRQRLADVGGLGALKTWLRRRRAAFSDEARAFGLPVPKGILLLGVQGCGKSLTAKAVSREWGMPLLRLDVGRVFGRYIGESEAAIRRAIRTAEAVAPAILWIDEIEKGFAGAGSDAVDAGVSARVLATFLTWLQEKQKPVFVFATANQIRNLPPELLRKGRFDELFFVDLPDATERAEIFAVHLRRCGRAPEGFDLAALAARTEGFTGAEIEQVVHEALYVAFAEGRRPLTQADLETAAREVIPISVTMKEGIAAMRQWAAARARPAS